LGAAKSVGSGLLRQFGNPLRNIPVVGGFLADQSQKALGLARGGMVEMKKGMAMGGKVNGMKGEMSKDKYTRGLEGETKKNVFQK